MTPGGAPIAGIARLVASQWVEVAGGLGSGANGQALAVFGDGPNRALYVGGDFDHAGGLPVARWNGTAWSALGSGITEPHYPPAEVLALAVVTLDGAPRLIVGGIFDRAGGQIANNIAAWDGAA